MQSRETVFYRCIVSAFHFNDKRREKYGDLQIKTLVCYIKRQLATGRTKGSKNDQFYDFDTKN